MDEDVPQPGTPQPDTATATAPDGEKERSTQEEPGAVANQGSQGLDESALDEHRAKRRRKPRKKPAAEKKTYASKFEQLGDVVHSLRDDVLQAYAGNKAAFDRLRKGETATYVWRLDRNPIPHSAVSF